MKRLLLLSLLLLGMGIMAVATNPHVPRGPVIVADVSFLAQTVDLPRTTVFTPSAAGMYRVSTYFEVVPQPASNTCTSLEIIWTDDQNVLHGSQVASCTEHGGGAATVYAVAGSTIQIDTQSLSLNGNAFNVFVVIEQL